MVQSSFRLFKKLLQIGLVSTRLSVVVVFVQARQNKNWFNWKNLNRWVCVFTGEETVTTYANPMPLVHSILYQPCTACIWCASIVTVLSPIKTQNYTHVFFLLCSIPTRAYIKFGQKTGWQRDICRKIADFEPPKTGTRLRCRTSTFCNTTILLLVYTTTQVLPGLPIQTNQVQIATLNGVSWGNFAKACQQPLVLCECFIPS